MNSTMLSVQYLSRLSYLRPIFASNSKLDLFALGHSPNLKLEAEMDLGYAMLLFV